jgi:hypothetical protein
VKLAHYEQVSVGSFVDLINELVRGFDPAQTLLPLFQRAMMRPYIRAMIKSVLAAP